MKKVAFVPNVPQELALKDQQGRVVSRRRGDRTLYTLTDGRVMSASMDLASKILELGVNAQEPFGICKRWNGRRGHPVYWDVWLTPAAEKARAVAEMNQAETDLEHQLRESIALVRRSAGISGPSEPPKIDAGAAASAGMDQPAHSRAKVDQAEEAPDENNRNGERDVPASKQDQRSIEPSWAQVLQSQTELLADVYAASIKYASTRHGNAVKPEDVRALMTTAFINLAQRGRTRVA